MDLMVGLEGLKLPRHIESCTSETESGQVILTGES